MASRKTDKWYRTRGITLVRKELLSQGRVPHRVSAADALAVLHGIANHGGELFTWYAQAGAVTLNKWRAEWGVWAFVEIDFELYNSGTEGVRPVS